MRIAIIAGGVAPIGGIEHFLCDLSSALKHDGHELEIVCWDVSRSRSNAVLDEMRQSSKRLTVLPFKSGCRYGLPDLAMLPFAVRASRRSDLLLFGKTLHKNFHALFDPYLRRTPSILVTPYRPREMWEARSVPTCLQSFRAVVVQSEDFVEDLRMLGYGGTIEVIPYLLPTLRPQTAFPPLDVLQVGFLGRLEAPKNIELLLSAISILSRSQDVRFNVFGDGSLNEKLQDFACGLKLQNIANFHGLVPRASVARAIDSCHIFAFASHTEGQCLAALEILSRGRPIVATGVGAFPEILSEPHFGRLYRENTAPKLAEAITDVFDEIRTAKIRPELIQTAFAANFSRKNILSRYAAILRRTAASCA